MNPIDPMASKNESRHGLRWQSASGDTAFERTRIIRSTAGFRACPKRRGAALPAGLQDAPCSPTVCESTVAILDCGGKRSATPLSYARKLSFNRRPFVRPKAPSSLRFAGALQNLAAERRFKVVTNVRSIFLQR
jgi:hypothetical protein